MLIDMKIPLKAKSMALRGSRTVLSDESSKTKNPVKYFADAKCEISAGTLVKCSACAEREMKSTAAAISHAGRVFHAAKRYFTHPQGWISLIHYSLLLITSKNSECVSVNSE